MIKLNASDWLSVDFSGDNKICSLTHAHFTNDCLFKFIQRLPILPVRPKTTKSSTRFCIVCMVFKTWKMQYLAWVILSVHKTSLDSYTMFELCRVNRLLWHDFALSSLVLEQSDAHHIASNVQPNLSCGDQVQYSAEAKMCYPTKRCGFKYISKFIINICICI